MSLLPKLPPKVNNQLKNPSQTNSLSMGYINGLLFYTENMPVGKYMLSKTANKVSPALHLEKKR